MNTAIVNRKAPTDKEKVYHKTKLLLKIYRDVIWSIEDRLDDLETECLEMGSMI